MSLPITSLFHISAAGKNCSRCRWCFRVFTIHRGHCTSSARGNSAYQPQTHLRLLNPAPLGLSMNVKCPVSPQAEMLTSLRSRINNKKQGTHHLPTSQHMRTLDASSSSPFYNYDSASMPSDDAKDTGCIATTFERKYYQRDQTFVKRNLRPREYRTGYRGLHVPPLGKQRLMNEAESLQYIGKHTDIPVPKVYCHFLDDDAYYIITELVDGVSMADLADEQKRVVCEELESHTAKLRTLRSARLGGPSGIVVPPYRVLKLAETESWDLQASTSEDYVFCHNDLSQQNVIVDPDSLKIKAIIDWEYAGFFPPQFDYPFYKRLGPSSAINGEMDDSVALLQFLRSQARDSYAQLPA